MIPMNKNKITGILNECLPGGLESISDASIPPRINEPPLIGSSWKFIRHPFEFVSECRVQGDVVRFRLAASDFYLISHPDAIDHILIRNNQNYRKGAMTQLLRDIVGNGIVTSERDVWRRQRHMANPAFDPEHITSYADTMTDYTERLTSEWKGGETINIRKEMSQLMLEIISQTLFKADIREDDRGERVVRALDTLFVNSWGTVTGIFDRVPEWVPLPPRQRYHAAISELDAVVYSIIADRRRSDDKGDDALSMLLAAEDEKGRKMTDEELRDMVIALLIAGFGTTAFAMSATLFLVGHHPLVEKLLVEELDSVLGDKTPTDDDLDELEYTERVIKESMRLYPPAPRVISREATQDDEIDGYRIPAGSQILISQWATHRDSRWYEDPITFDPDRWTKEREASRPPMAYYPFAAGPRRCLGDRFAMQETKLVLATILQQYHLEIHTEKLDHDPGATTAHSDAHPIEATVRRRRNENQ
ncbi:cytochrome P450 [Haladaptatus sp. AB618]|uniref:cytochrome P450 n=1 Tax=Haladaptatus sp. AB618 TaxID=2934173 RepID=UPI0034E9370D